MKKFIIKKFKCGSLEDTGIAGFVFAESVEAARNKGENLLEPVVNEFVTAQRV